MQCNWIDVNELLPTLKTRNDECGQYLASDFLLAYDGNPNFKGLFRVGIGWLEKVDFEDKPVFVVNDNITKTITHWMPIPDMPCNKTELEKGGKA